MLQNLFPAYLSYCSFHGCSLWILLQTETPSHFSHTPDFPALLCFLTNYLWTNPSHCPRLSSNTTTSKNDPPYRNKFFPMNIENNFFSIIHALYTKEVLNEGVWITEIDEWRNISYWRHLYWDLCFLFGSARDNRLCHRKLVM